MELGLINYGMSTGTTATGLLLLRMVDKDLESGAAEDYALAAPLSAPFIGGGLLTLMMPLLHLHKRCKIVIPSGIPPAQDVGFTARRGGMRGAGRMGSGETKYQKLDSNNAGSEMRPWVPRERPLDPTGGPRRFKAPIRDPKMEPKWMPKVVQKHAQKRVVFLSGVFGGFCIRKVAKSEPNCEVKT